MQVLCRRARRDAEVLAEPKSKRVVDEQRLRRVPLRHERLHQEPVPALAIGSAVDQSPGGTLRRLELTAADLEARPADELERAHEDLVEALPLLGDPGRVFSGQQLSGRDVLRDAAGAPCARKVALRDETLGAVQALGRRFQIDPGRVGESQPHITPALERYDPAQLREQRAEPVRIGGLVPERIGELVPRHRPVPVDGEERERDPPLSPGQIPFDAPPVDARDEPAAELDPRLPKVSPR